MSRPGPRWEDPRTVAGFVSGPPNETLIRFAREMRRPSRLARCLDLGCGAGRNALPLAELSYRVAAVDLSGPMLEGARERLRRSPTTGVDLVLSPMAPLPFADTVFDLVVAHGIWNLAGSGAEFRSAVSEAARVARPGAGLFLFTFSRDTLPVDAIPDPGESFVFSSWNGEPQCFLTEREILDELARSRFVRDQPGPLTVHNRRRPGDVWVGGSPVIFEGTFRRAGGRC